MTDDDYLENIAKLNASLTIDDLDDHLDEVDDGEVMTAKSLMADGWVSQGKTGFLWTKVLH